MHERRREDGERCGSDVKLSETPSTSVTENRRKTCTPAGTNLVTSACPCIQQFLQKLTITLSALIKAENALSGISMMENL